MTRTTLITVSYNSASALEAYFAALDPNVPVVVVDNGSSDASAALAERAGAAVIRLGQNTGFAHACNCGARDVKTEFLLFLNPDGRLEPGALAALEAAADAFPQAVAFNPTLIEADGSVFFRRSSKLLPRRQWAEKSPPPGDIVVPILSGAAFFVRRSAFEAVGGFDERLFLFFEDDDLALRLGAIGALMRIDKARVTHAGGTGSASTPETTRLKAFHMARSRVLACRKHGRPMPMLAAFGTALRKSLDPRLLFSRRKRAQTAGYWQGLMSVLREGNQGA